MNAILDQQRQDEFLQPIIDESARKEVWDFAWIWMANRIFELASKSSPLANFSRKDLHDHQ